MKDFLEIGKIVATQGIKGEVRVQSFCDHPEILAEFEEVCFDDQGLTWKKVLKSRVQKNVVIFLLEGISTRNEGELLRGTMLYGHREDFALEENTFFVADILGLEVVHAETQESYGIIVDITSAGGNEVYHIKNNQGKFYYIPAIASVVKQTNLAEKVMKIIPLKGLFEDAD